MSIVLISSKNKAVHATRNASVTDLATYGLTDEHVLFVATRRENVVRPYSVATKELDKSVHPSVRR